MLIEVHWLESAPLALEGSVPIRLHLLSTEVLGDLRPIGLDALQPGQTGHAEVRLREPIVAVRGDRVILRRPSPETTLGGGVVLHPAPRGRRGADLARQAKAVAVDKSLDDVLLAWTREAGLGGLTASEAACRLGILVDQVVLRLDSLATAGRLLEAPLRERRWVIPAAIRSLGERTTKILRAYFDRDRLARGCSKAEAASRAMPGLAPKLAELYLGWLAAAGLIIVDGDRVDLPGRGSALTSEESKLSQRILDYYQGAGLTPPAPTAVAIELGVKDKIADGIVRYLTEHGKLVRIPGGLVLAATVLDDMVAQLRAGEGWDRFVVARFKDHFGLSRKWAIPLLEHLDSTGVTRRLGDERMLVRSEPG